MSSYSSQYRMNTVQEREHCISGSNSISNQIIVTTYSVYQLAHSYIKEDHPEGCGEKALLDNSDLESRDQDIVSGLAHLYHLGTVYLEENSSKNLHGSSRHKTVHEEKIRRTS